MCLDFFLLRRHYSQTFSKTSFGTMQVVNEAQLCIHTQCAFSLIPHRLLGDARRFQPSENWGTPGAGSE